MFPGAVRACGGHEAIDIHGKQVGGETAGVLGNPGC
jgi:hypothetical protein